jgi:predicted ATPase
MEGNSQEGMLELEKGIAAWQATGAGATNSHHRTLKAEVLNLVSQAEGALHEVDQARAEFENTADLWWEAEIYRLRGILLLQHSMAPQAEAEVWLRRALEVARRQQAKSLELRAATSLARLWCDQGKQAEAHALLAPVYAWFTEGFHTSDLKEARTLLERGTAEGGEP